MKRLTMIAMTSAAALGLAACGTEEEPVVDDAFVEEDVVDEGYPVGGEMTAEQQTRYEEYDWQTASEEYDTNVETMRQETASAATTGSSMGADASMDAQTGPDTGMAGGSGDAMMAQNTGGTQGIPPRSEMSFDWLDRNSDGQLSVAEYAIWALPTDPTEPAPNDARPPYLTQAEINEAGQTFFYFDDDGDTYLSQSEFQDARTSARAPA